MTRALDDLNAALPGALAALRVDALREGFAWRFSHEEGDLAPMLAPVVRSAAELIGRFPMSSASPAKASSSISASR